MICPNLKNPDIQYEFEKMQNVFGSTRAYNLWSLNGGVPLNMINENTESEIYKKTIEKEGERYAMIAKAYTLSDEFKDRFGEGEMLNGEPVLYENIEQAYYFNGEHGKMYINEEFHSSTYKAFINQISDINNGYFDHTYQEIKSINQNYAPYLTTKQFIESYVAYISANPYAGINNFLSSLPNSKIIQDFIQSGDIVYTTEYGKLCAANGLTDTSTGTGWKIVKDFKNMPTHLHGGVDITISDKGVSMRRGGKDIKAAHGLLIIKE